MQQPEAWPAQVSTKALASQKVLHFSWDLQTPNLLEKDSNNSRNNMKSQIKNEKKKQKYKFVELLIPTLNKFIRYQFLLILLEKSNHQQSSQNN